MHVDLGFVRAGRWAACTVLLLCGLAASPVHAADTAASSPPTDTAVPMPQTPLDVRWVLLNIGHTQIKKPQGAAQEPFMTLSAAPPSASASAAAPTARAGKLEGFGGCNQFGGRFDLDGARLTFGPGIVMTRMTCPDRAALDLESRFAQALQACARWHIVNGGLDGPALELLDETGTVLARFIAPPPRR